MGMVPLPVNIRENTLCDHPVVQITTRLGSLHDPRKEWSLVIFNGCAHNFGRECLIGDFKRASYLVIQYILRT
jgi:hypothetical protein